MEFEKFPPCPLCGGDAELRGDGLVGCPECGIYTSEDKWLARSGYYDSMKQSALADALYGIMQELGVEGRAPSFMTVGEITELGRTLKAKVARRKKLTHAPEIRPMYMRKVHAYNDSGLDVSDGEQDAFFDDEELAEIVENENALRSTFSEKIPKNRHKKLTSDGVIDFFDGAGQFVFCTLLVGIVPSSHHKRKERPIAEERVDENLGEILSQVTQ